MNVGKRQVYGTTSMDIKTSTGSKLKLLKDHFERDRIDNRSVWTNSDVLEWVMDDYMAANGLTPEGLAQEATAQLLEDIRRGSTTG